MKKRKTAQEIREYLVAAFATAMKVPPASIDVDSPVESLGLTSLVGFSMSSDFGKWLGSPVPPTLFWDFPTIGAIADHLGAK